MTSSTPLPAPGSTRSRRSWAISGPLPSITAGTVAWVLVIALFILLRVGVVWRAPVGGAELAHLSGAWQARTGIEDHRYVPTLFQAVSALSFGWTDSETPSRALALAGSLTIPLALFLLRRALGDGGALLALLLLALDPLGIILGVTATAAAWDAAIAVWLVVALVASRPPPWGWLLLAFLVATAGPITLPVVLAAVGLGVMRGERPSREAFLWGALGTALGVLLTSLQFGLGVGGLRIAPILLLADGFEETWSSVNVAGLAALYGLPVLVGGASAAAWLVIHLRSARRTPTPAAALILGMGMVALLWFLVALPSHSPFPLAATTLALSLLLGPALARAVSFLLTAPWRRQGYLLALAAGLVAVALFVLSDWAREGRVGGADERVLVAIAVFLSVIAVALLAIALLSSYREELPLTLLPALAGGFLLLLAGASGVALSAAGEPLPGPVSPASARAVRDVALQAASSPGAVVIHERYREALTWPFRHSPTVTLASRVPHDGEVAVWPVDAPPPEGFVPLEGHWALERSIAGPGSFLELVHWFAERNSLRQDLELVAIYVRSP